VTVFRKRELLLYYGVGYLITAVLETILFTILIGSYSFRDIMLNFSLWGITWLVSMFVYPMFFTDANSANLAFTPYLSLVGYVIIIAVFYATYRFHKNMVESRLEKRLSFNKLIDLYFSASKEPEKDAVEKESPKPYKAKVDLEVKD